MLGRTYILLSLLGLGIVALGAQFQSTPGYMDAEYYYAGGERLVAGHGFSEMILWNYINDPDGLPNPSHGYWMPMVSIVAAIGMKAAGQIQFSSAQFGFLILAAAIPVVTAALSYSMTQAKDVAMVSGLFAAFPGFYLSYLGTTDAFSLYMLFGAVFFLLLRRNWTDTPREYPLMASILFGLIAGLMHLTRADGILWLLISMIAIWMQTRKMLRPGWIMLLFALCAMGYLLVMGPWMARNYTQFGTLLNPGGLKNLWLTSYDELYLYPSSLLTFEHWWSTGLRQILMDRVLAAGMNLQSAIAVQGEIFLLPFILAGFWLLRQDRRVQVGLIAWLITFVVMTFVFPYAGSRGGFFHSGVAVQPIWWAVAPLGLGSIVTRVGKIRRWNLHQATRFFQVGSVGIALLLSVLVFFVRVIGVDDSSIAWISGNAHYSEVERVLVKLGADHEDIVMVNNSPGYYVASGRSAVSIPYGDIQTVLDVVKRYHVRYLLLEIDQVLGGEDLYQRPGDRGALIYLGSVEKTRIYEFQLP